MAIAGEETPLVLLMNMSSDVLVRCFSFLLPAELCRLSTTSSEGWAGADLVFKSATSLTVVRVAPFVTDEGLSNLLHRCPALVEIDIDARRLSEAGAVAVAEALPRLTGVHLRNGYGWSGIGSLTMAVARASGMLFPRPSSSASASAPSLRVSHADNERAGVGSSSSSAVATVATSTSMASPPAEADEASRAETSLGRCGDTTNVENLAAPASYSALSPAYGGRKSYRRGHCVLALRSLALCNLGPANGLNDPSPEHFEEWSRLAEASAPVLRSLTLTNASAGQLPLCALTPFFGYPRLRSAAASTAGSNPTVENTRQEATAAATVAGSARGVGKTAADSMRCGLVELTLATVSAKLAATVLRGVKRPVPLCFRGEGGAAFPGGPRPPLTTLRRLSLVVDDVTDALCSAISEGCPNVREVSLSQTVGFKTTFSDDGPTALASCKQLTSLSLRSDYQGLRGCSDVGLVFMTMGLGRLEQLELCGVSRATDTTAAAILDLEGRRLRRLRLEGCEQLEGHVFIQPPLSTAQSCRRALAISLLTSVSLARSKDIAPEALHALASAFGPCLESLDLSSCCVTDDVLVPVLALQGLQDLAMSRCPFTNEGLVAACASNGNNTDDASLWTSAAASAAPPPPTPSSTPPPAAAWRHEEQAPALGRDVTTEKAEKRPCARWPRNEAPPPITPPLPPRHTQQPLQQRLKKLNLAGCRGARASGLMALLQSDRLGRHTQALDVNGLEVLEDEHVKVLLTGLTCLQELRLSGCGKLTRLTVAAIVRSECGSSTLSVLDLRRCHGIHPATLALVKPPALPALSRLAWWGDDAEAEKMAAIGRGGNCWITPGSG